MRKYKEKTKVIKTYDAIIDGVSYHIIETLESKQSILSIDVYRNVMTPERVKVIEEVMKER